mmetsp:Transcript_3585/g.10190  ORF Transcript_3585/g.10190 Transcript_3585/m.10190 type:complete len:208 (-) Transcript_3585:1231-1854(-)
MVMARTPYVAVKPRKFCCARRSPSRVTAVPWRESVPTMNGNALRIWRRTAGSLVICEAKIVSIADEMTITVAETPNVHLSKRTMVGFAAAISKDTDILRLPVWLPGFSGSISQSFDANAGKNACERLLPVSPKVKQSIPTANKAVWAAAGAPPSDAAVAAAELCIPILTAITKRKGIKDRMLEMVSHVLLSQYTTGSPSSVVAATLH